MANSTLGFQHSEESKNKIRAAFIGIPLTPEQRLKSINAEKSSRSRLSIQPKPTRFVPAKIDISLFIFMMKLII